MPTQAVPTLIQGVSQQSVQQRRDTQCEAQFDCINSALEGAVARPGTELVRVYSATLTGAFFQEIIRDGENYLVAVIGNQVLAYDLADGTPCVVTMTAGAAYIDTGAGAARTKIRAQPVEDTTFLANRQVVPAMLGTTTAAQAKEALVFVRSSAYKATYAINLGAIGSADAVAARAYTPSPDQPGFEAYAKTDYVALGLHEGYTSPGADVPTPVSINGVAGFVSVRAGSSLKVTRSDALDFNIVSEDGGGDELMRAFKGTVPSASDLPARAFPAMKFKVIGEAKTQVDNYYVEFQGDPTIGRWVETAGFGVKTTINPATMPHLLVNTGYRTFELKTATWSTRIAGDEETAKDPSFIGRGIRDVFYHQRRLAFMHASGCSWSKTRFPYTFFPDTVQTQLSNSPVDATFIAGASARGPSSLDYAVLVDESLYLWGQRAQFRVHSGSEPFKTETVEGNPASAYEYAAGCDPLAFGSFLYFATEGGPYASLRSIRFAGGKIVGDLDVTSHLPEYIESGVQDLVASDTLRMILVQTSGYPQGLALYNFTYNGEELVQSGWNKWRIPGGPILWASIRDKTLRMLQQRDNNVVALLRMNLAPKAIDADAGATYMTRLDLRVDETDISGLAYDNINDRTSFTLPYVPDGTAQQDIRVITRENKSGGFTRGRSFKVLSVVGAVVTVEDDLTGYKFYAGHRITAERVESQFFVRGRDGVVPTDRLTVGRFGVNFSTTGYTRLEVSTTNGQERQAEFEGRTLGAPSAVTETPVLSAGKLEVGVGELSRNATIRMVNDSYLPSYWQSAYYTYEGVGVKGQS